MQLFKLAAALSIMLVLLSCAKVRQGNGSQQQPSLSFDCGRSTGPGYSDPRALAQDYVRLDGAGEFGRASNWHYHYCPNGIPGWDIVTVVKNARIDSVIVADSVASAYVTYDRLGRGDGNSFTQDVDTERAALKMVRLRNGWWLHSMQNPHFLVETALAWPALRWSDSVRSALMQLARR